MFDTEIYAALDKGGSVTFHLAGVTFPSISNPRLNRQSYLAELRTEQDLKLVIELDNPFDIHAVRVDTLEGDDVGYVSKKGDAWVNTHKIYRPNLNQVLKEYQGVLCAKVEGVFGGYRTKNFGATVKVFATSRI